MKTTTERNKSDGRYTFTGGLDRVCACGHTFGVHIAGAPHRCDNENWGDGAECTCRSFRPVKAA